MTYQDYLDNWELMFGEETSGEYAYYNHGRRYPVPVHRLSEKEFNEHLKALNVASDHFDEAFKADDSDGLDKALAESFPHELALLI